MKIVNGLYRLIYDYYETRIIYGFYSHGDKLPSISQMSVTFRLAPATVREALAMLEKNGYIRVDARKAARVIYKAERGQYRENAARYFVPRQEGIVDLAASGQLLFEPLWEAGLARLDDKDWDEFMHRFTATFKGAVSMPVKFYIMTLGALNNKLILNLYWEMVRYIRFPYMAGPREREQNQTQLNGQSKEAVTACLKDEFEKSYTKAVTSLFTFIATARTEYGLENEPQIPFVWDIYRQRPQLRYSLASRIIREIISGRYPVGSYLPSLPSLSQQYGVALNTIRRTLSILASLGVTRSYHGKGTLVCMEPVQIDLTRTEICEGLRLYLESLELMELTIEKIVVYTMNSVDADKYRELTQSYRDLSSHGRSDISMELMLAFIEYQCPLALIRECYSKLRELLVWGYPFTLYRLQDKNLDAEYRPYARQSLSCLDVGDVEGLGRLWRNFATTESERIRAFLEPK